MWLSRRRVLSAIVAAAALTLVSGTPFSRAAAHKTKSLAPSPVVAVREPAHHVVTTFEIHSANTLESVTVRYVDDVLDPTSKQQLDHLMRCLRTDSAKPIDPRLIDALRGIAKEVDAPLWLVSAYRAPQSWRDHNFHNRAQAADIRVEGMPAWKLRKIARSLGVKGVGWYPTTNMIHVDVRDEEYFWTDWSGPGQIGREIRTR
jgi:uncharacterized protein YcbK (DUF882 family)